MTQTSTTPGFHSRRSHQITPSSDWPNSRSALARFRLVMEVFGDFWSVITLLAFWGAVILVVAWAVGAIK